MSAERELLKEIKRPVSAGRYRVRIHAVRHMVEEGFGEGDMLEAVAGRSRILENYPDDSRCLVVGYSPSAKAPGHRFTSSVITRTPA